MRVKLAGESGFNSSNLLLHEGKEHRFNFANKYLGEFDMTFNYRFMQDVDIVSILVYGSNIELAFDTADGFSKRKTSVPVSQLARILPSTKGFITGLERRIDNACVQYIYVYISGSIDSKTFLN